MQTSGECSGLGPSLSGAAVHSGHLILGAALNLRTVKATAPELPFRHRPGTGHCQSLVTPELNTLFRFLHWGGRTGRVMESGEAGLRTWQILPGQSVGPSDTQQKGSGVDSRQICPSSF